VSTFCLLDITVRNQIFQSFTLHIRTRLAITDLSWEHRLGMRLAMTDWRWGHRLGMRLVITDWRWEHRLGMRLAITDRGGDTDWE